MIEHVLQWIASDVIPAASDQAQQQAPVVVQPQSPVVGIVGALISAVVPLLLFWFLFAQGRASAARQNRLIEGVFARLQKKRRSRIITLVHRAEPMGFLGIPSFRYIDLNDAEDILEAIRQTPSNTPIEIVLHTPGGLVLPALQIARALKAHKGKKTVFVPHYAMSGGTLIALAADEIVLNSHAVLGPIDPQIGGLPAASILRVAAKKSPDATDDYTLVLADLGQMAIDQLEAAAKELLKGTVSDNAAASIAQMLSSGLWTHDYPIGAVKARELGLNISTDFPADIADLVRLFPERVRSSARWTRSASEGKMARSGGATSLAPREPSAEATPFTGYQPGPGARSFSYGPWNPNSLRPQGHAPGPGYADLREDRSLRRPSRERD